MRQCRQHLLQLLGMLHERRGRRWRQRSSGGPREGADHHARLRGSCGGGAIRVVPVIRRVRLVERRVRFFSGSAAASTGYDVTSSTAFDSASVFFVLLPMEPMVGMCFLGHQETIATAMKAAISATKRLRLRQEQQSDGSVHDSHVVGSGALPFALGSELAFGQRVPDYPDASGGYGYLERGVCPLVSRNLCLCQHHPGAWISIRWHAMCLSYHRFSWEHEVARIVKRLQFFLSTFLR
ncbi:unnamed protein product, partial [Ectocarpus sp. 12 AP-2014]